MKAFKISVLGVAIAIMALLFFLFQQQIMLFFGNLRMAFVGTASENLSYQSLLAFKIAAEGLSAASSTASSSLPALMDGFRYVPAGVFSNYPFNNYSFLTIDAGSDQGLKPGMPVLAGETILLGKITAVRAHQAEVQTFFDPSWKSSVFIGTEQVNGLLDGGPSPYVDFIPKSATTTAEMGITNADASFPMGLLVGTVDSVESINNNLWQRARIKPLFDLSSLRQVFVIINF